MTFATRLRPRDDAPHKHPHINHALQGGPHRRRTNALSCRHPWKDRKPVAAALKQVYDALNDTEAEKALTAFEQGPWGQKYEAIGKAWRRAWQEVIPFFAFPREVRVRVR